MARGTVRQRSIVRKDSWTVQIYTGVDPEIGKTHYHSEAVKGTKALAQRQLTEFLREVDTGNFVEPTRLTVAEYFEQWLRNSAGPRVSSRTLESYRGNLDRYLGPKLGRIPLEKLTPRHVQEMEAQLLQNGGRNGRPLSPRTVLQAHRVLSKALNDAVKLGYLARNVVDAVEPPRTTKYEGQFLDWEEVHVLLDQITDPLRQTLALLAIQTGLRRSELLGLHWRDINFSSGALSVRRALIKLASGGTELKVPKNGHRRVVDLPADSVEALRAHRGRNPETSGNGNFVFCHSDGSALDPDLITQAFERIAKKNGLKGLRLHDLRHTHASLMLSQGIHPKIVSERLGHSSIGITIDLYSHVLPTVQGEAVSHFGAEWKKRNGKRMANSAPPD
jgi:integrase